MAEPVEVDQEAIPAVSSLDVKTASAGLQAADTKTARQSPAAKSVEKHVNQLLVHISPTSESNAKRQRVIDFVQGLVKQHFLSIGYEVSCERNRTPPPPLARMRTQSQPGFVF